MAERVTKAKQQRRTVRSQLTTFRKFLTEYPSRQDALQLKIRLEKLDEIWKNFDAAQSTLEELDSEGEGIPAIREEIEEVFFELKAKAQRFLRTEEGSNVSEGSGTRNNTKLPKLSLPEFNGSYEKWIAFKDAFTSLIHNEASLDPVQKLQYLGSCLSGEAAEAIAAFETTAENYEEAWSLLTELYNNPRVIILRHLSLLFTLPPIQRDSPNSLRQLINNVQQHLRCLKSLGQPTEEWDSVLIHLLTERLDKDTRKEWEHSLTDTAMPTLKVMMSFLTRVSQATGGSKVVEHTKTSNQSFKPRQSRITQALVTAQALCHICAKGHYTQQCDKLLNLVPTDRISTVKEAKLCVNCLRPNHTSFQCRSSKCRKCHKKHHTLLHLDTRPSPVVSTSEITNTRENAVSQPSTSSTTMTTQISDAPSQVLLATAIVYIRNKDGNKRRCRALLDSASQSHFITNKLAEESQLPKSEICTPIMGLNNISTRTKYAVTAMVQSRDNRFSTSLRLLMIPQITGFLPSHQVNRESIEIPKNLFLADPEFQNPAEIDILIGAGLFFSLMCVGQTKAIIRNPSANSSNPVLQKTRLGWIISSEVPERNQRSNQQSSCHLIVKSEDNLERQIQKFWQIEEKDNTPKFTVAEKLCEEHFVRHTQRLETGKYMVRLPFQSEAPKLGESYNIALKRFRSLEFKLNKNQSLKKDYNQFLEDYERLEYMAVITEPYFQENCYFLPHHAVVKDSSTTTKVRVVFDGSAKTTTGVSLNDTLMAGPTIQEDLFSIIIRFRTHNYVLSADIEKMFLQVAIHPEDRKFLQILWRKESDQPIKRYQLNTVPFGLTCSPFLAVRCLHQLAQDEQDNYPRAAAILQKDFYMDDLQTGAETFEEACQIRDDLIKLLKKGGFHLRQWCSNDKRILDTLPESVIYRQLYEEEGSTIKALGIHWNSAEDTIVYTIRHNHIQGNITKRIVLSEIAKLFDPLGLLGPVIATAKIIMQQLWHQKLEWDESLPSALHSSWKKFRDQLHTLNNLTTPRQVTAKNPKNIELHGFCDASQKAYGACIYIRSTNSEGYTTAQLVCSKSRIAPLKTITIPRLELCAAVLLAQLYKIVEKILNLKFSRSVFWTDSTITLCWIRSPAHTLKTFVGNRVAEIQNITSPEDWRHVSSADNPADAISRGQLPSDFVTNEMWFNGPSWLNLEETYWPKMDIKTPSEIPEERKQIVLSATNNNNEILRKFSSFSKLRRVIAYCLRFKDNTQGTKTTTITLLPSEIQAATTCLVKMLQREVFSKEIHYLQRKNELPTDSKLQPLNPFLDEGVLRVGGRIKHANIPYAQKYPILLPRSHPVTDAIIRYEHVKNYHAGIQGTLYAVRQNYWPLDGRNQTRRIIRKCTTCTRMRPTEYIYKMGELPINRVTESRPFTNVGLDYCGPM